MMESISFLRWAFLCYLGSLSLPSHGVQGFFCEDSSTHLSISQYPMCHRTSQMGYAWASGVSACAGGHMRAAQPDLESARQLASDSGHSMWLGVLCIEASCYYSDGTSASQFATVANEEGLSTRCIAINGASSRIEGLSCDVVLPTLCETFPACEGVGHALVHSPNGLHCRKVFCETHGTCLFQASETTFGRRTVESCALHGGKSPVLTYELFSAAIAACQGTCWIGLVTEGSRFLWLPDYSADEFIHVSEASWWAPSTDTKSSCLPLVDGQLQRMPCHQAATALCAVNITGHAELLPPSPHVLTAANNPRPSPSPTPQPPSTLNNSGDVVIMNHLQPIAAWFVEQCQDSVHISGEIGAKAVVAGLQLAPLLSIKPLPCVFTTYGSKLGENWRILKRETVNVDSTLVKFETTALTEAVFTEMGAGEDEDCFDFQGELSCPNIQISSESPLSWLSTGGQTKARTTSLQRCLTMASSPCSSAWWEDMSGVPLSSVSLRWPASNFSVVYLRVEGVDADVVHCGISGHSFKLVSQDPLVLQATHQRHPLYIAPSWDPWLTVSTVREMLHCNFTRDGVLISTAWLPCSVEVQHAPLIGSFNGCSESTVSPCSIFITSGKELLNITAAKPIDSLLQPLEPRRHAMGHSLALSFSNNMKVTIGETYTGVEEVDASGNWIVISLPHYDDLCTTQNQKCMDSAGLFHLNVVHEPTSEVLTSCPPACPGIAPADIPPSFMTFPDQRTAALEGHSFKSLGPASMFSSMGILYVKPCKDYPFGIRCLDPSTASQCGYVSQGLCRPCPTGGLCPGGPYVLAQPGWWMQSNSSTPVQCKPPVSRCPGWQGLSLSAPATCAEGFDGPACGACAQGWYQTSGGDCLRCQNEDMDWSAVLAVLGALAGIFIGFALLVIGVVLLTVRLHGGSVRGGLGRAIQVILSSISLLQLLAQLGYSTSSNLPSWLQSVFVHLQVLQFSPPLHLDCLSQPMFVYENVLFAFSMGLVLSLTLLYLFCPQGANAYLTRRTNPTGSVVFHVNPLMQQQSKIVTQPSPMGREDQGHSPNVQHSWWRHVGVPWLKYGLFTAGSLIYPVVVTKCANAIYCVRPGDSLADFSVLASNPDIVCFVAEHKDHFAIAMSTMLAFVLGFPVLSYALVWRHLRRYNFQPRSRPLELRHHTAWCYCPYRVNRAEQLASESKSLAIALKTVTQASSSSLRGHAFTSERYVKSSKSNLKRHSKRLEFGRLVAQWRNEECDPAAEATEFSCWLKGDFRPSLFWMRHFELIMFLLIAFLQPAALYGVNGGSPTSDVTWSVSLAIILCLSANFFVVYAIQPYMIDHLWKYHVRLAVLIVMMFGTAVSALALNEAKAAPEATPSTTLTVLSSLLLLGCILIFLFMIVMFWIELLQGAQAEEEEQIAQTIARRNRALSKAIPAGPPPPPSADALAEDAAVMPTSRSRGKSSTAAANDTPYNDLSSLPHRSRSRAALRSHSRSRARSRSRSNTVRSPRRTRSMRQPSVTSQCAAPMHGDEASGAKRGKPSERTSIISLSLSRKSLAPSSDAVPDILMWECDPEDVVGAAAAEPLIRHIDPRTGCAYYEDRTQGDTVWENSLIDVFLASQEPWLYEVPWEQEIPRILSQATAAQVPLRALLSWRCFFSEQGDAYWYNDDTEESVWDADLVGRIHFYEPNYPLSELGPPAVQKELLRRLFRDFGYRKRIVTRGRMLSEYFRVGETAQVSHRIEAFENRIRFNKTSSVEIEYVSARALRSQKKP